MPAPTYRCFCKVNATTNQGIICENVNCVAYDGETEHCAIIEAVQILLKLKGKADPNNA